MFRSTTESISTTQAVQPLGSILTSFGEDQFNTENICRDLTCFYGKMARGMFLLVSIGLFALIVIDTLILSLLISWLLNEQTKNKQSHTAFSAIIIRYLGDKDNDEFEDEDSEDEDSEDTNKANVVNK